MAVKSLSYNLRPSYPKDRIAIKVLEPTTMHMHHG